MKRALEEEVDVFAFKSSMMVRNFMVLTDEMGADEIIRVLNEKTVAAIGKPMADTLSEFGVKIKVMPERCTFEELPLKCRKQGIKNKFTDKLIT